MSNGMGKMTERLVLLMMYLQPVDQLEYLVNFYESDPIFDVFLPDDLSGFSFSQRGGKG